MFIRRLKCSFCRRPDAVVEKLVAGPRMLGVGPVASICDACVAAAQEIMQRPVDDGRVRARRPPFWARLSRRPQARMLREGTAAS